MTLKAAKFTPGVLLSAPRRSAGTPNPTGEKVLFTVSTYSFEERSKSSQIRVLDIKTGESTVLYDDVAYSEPVWIGEDEFLFLKSGDKGVTSLLLGRASQPKATPTELRAFDGGLSNLKTLRLADGTIAIALTGLADPQGKLYNPESDANKNEPPLTTGRVYTKLFVRHWDAYVTENTNTIWYGCLEPRQSATLGRSYSLASDGLTNLLAGTKLESPVPPFGGAGDFALGPNGVAFVSRDPAYNEATTTITNLYFVSVKSYADARPLAAPQAVATGALKGYSANPVFAPNGKSLVFSRMRSAQYESDKPQLLLVPDVTKLGSKSGGDAVEYYPSKDGSGVWDARPESILYSADGSELFVTAELHGVNTIYRLPSDPSQAAAHGLPQVVVGASIEVATEPGFRHLKSNGSVSDVKILASGDRSDSRLFLSSSSLIDSSFYSILNPGPVSAAEVTVETVSSQSRHGTTFGLSRQQVGELWFQGAGDYQVHALVMRPSDFDPKKKYPLALLIHGGPQGAWADSWSTRWNPAIFAEQGYIAVAPNPTGSTGYGMALQDGIQNQWGGRPYQDIVNCFEAVEKSLPYVDIERSVALGASYGGYMINWIQGQPLGRRLKALVCHDGVFSTLNQYTSEELFFPLHDFGGTLWDNRPGYEKWDPARFTKNWETPMLVIHNELDYRLPITEGLAMFNVLQSRKVPSRFLSFTDENHWVLKPENSLVWHREVLAWINKYAGVAREEDQTSDRAAGLAVSSAQVKI